jgi:hypothetical protein
MIIGIANEINKFKDFEKEEKISLFLSKKSLNLSTPLIKLTTRILIKFKQQNL